MQMQGQVDCVTAHFEQESRSWQEAYENGSAAGELFRTRLDLALSLFAGRVSPPGRALDLGCGCGPGALALTERGFDAVGVDISESMIATAQSEAARRGLSDRCRFIRADFGDVDFRPGEFDLILALGFLEYFDDAHRVMRRMRSLLSRRGILVLQTPNRQRLSYLLQGRMGWPVERWPSGLAFRQHTPREMERLAAYAGLSVIDYRGHNLGPLQIGRRFIPGYRASLTLRRGLDRIARHPWGRALGRFGSSFIVALRRTDDASQAP